MVNISDNFTPGASLFGGALIGAAASLHLATNGRTTGISGILAGTLSGQEGRPWRLLFLSGLGFGAVATQLFYPNAFGEPLRVGLLVPALAGGLVGFGTQLGSGCTSGHGICGLAFLSRRSLAAVATFMTTGSIASIAFSRTDGFGLASLLKLPIDRVPVITTGFVTAVFAVPVTVLGQLYASERKGVSAIEVTPATETTPAMIKPKMNVESVDNLLAAFGSGLLFSTGLAFSGMLDPMKVRSFLAFEDTWDPSLGMVMAGAVGVALTAFRFILCQPKPLLKPAFSYPTRRDLTLDLFLGAAIFGIGWGIGGICPAPGLMSITTARVYQVVWFLSLLLGIIAFQQFDKIRKSMFK